MADYRDPCCVPGTRRARCLNAEWIACTPNLWVLRFVGAYVVAVWHDDGAYFFAVLINGEWAFDRGPTWAEVVRMAERMAGVRR